ncbi:MAG: hypothetical protein PHE27_01510 [Alphaproteobacteria bacterium]|nr:hypothetical protein [Alphaproteobacteria bacterium]
MPLSQKEMAALVGFPGVFSLDRKTLPGEEIFSDIAQSKTAPFTDEQIDARLERLLELPDFAAVWKDLDAFDRNGIKNYLTKSTGWGFIRGDSAPWSQETVEMGRKIFGNWFDTYPQGDRRFSFAFVVPDSPYLCQGMQMESGFEFSLKHPSENLYLRHELSHCRFSFPPQKGDDIDLEYFDEAMADGASAHLHLAAAHTKEEREKSLLEVQELIHSRRLNAFMNLSPSSYWTAAAIEATLQKERIPGWAENAFAVRGLQVRVLDTHELAEITRREGERIVEAYNYFCPEKAVPFAPKLPPKPVSAPALAPR